MTSTAQYDGSLNTSVDLEQLSAYITLLFPSMGEREQQLSLMIYRLLAEGKPASIQQLTQATMQRSDEIEHTLHSWPGVFFDNNNNIIGFWGLTIQEMPHRMEVNGLSVYVWCAWDALFIPELLNATARVFSNCPVTNKNIEVIVSHDHAQAINSNDVVVSFLKPDINEFQHDVTTSFCHFVYFFYNRSAGKQWCSKHPNTFLLSLDEAFTVGKTITAVRYNLTLK